MVKKKRMKSCPGCKGTKAQPVLKFKGKHLCRPCKGTGEVKIINGRNKGGTFERNVAKQVSTWTGVAFARTPLSGGWNQQGDITPKDPEEMVDFPFNLELKNQEVLSVPAIFNMKDNQTIRAWWQQCVDDAKKSKRIPMLIFTKSRTPVFLLMRKKDFDRMGLSSLKTVLVQGKMRVVLWDDFLAIPYNTIFERLKRG